MTHNLNEKLREELARKLHEWYLDSIWGLHSKSYNADDLFIAEKVFEWHEKAVGQQLQSAKQRIEELENTVQHFLTSDVCKKCGHGVIIGCYGCLLKKSNVKISSLESLLDEVEKLIEKFCDAYYSGDMEIEIYPEAGELKNLLEKLKGRK